MDCGFLTIGCREVTEAERIKLSVRNASLPAQLDQLDCARGLWVEYGLTYAGRDPGLLLQEATKVRRCARYFRHVAGWSPEAHRALLLRREDPLWDLVRSACFAILGAALALLGQWGARYLGLR